MDTPARYGGDEFALVLPETGAEEARQIGDRVNEMLARESEFPPVRVSLGVASYPEHGETPELLLGAADRTLYEMKHAR